MVNGTLKRSVRFYKPFRAFVRFFQITLQTFAILKGKTCVIFSLLMFPETPFLKKLKRNGRNKTVVFKQ